MKVQRLSCDGLQRRLLVLAPALNCRDEHARYARIEAAIELGWVVRINGRVLQATKLCWGWVWHLVMSICRYVMSEFGPRDMFRLSLGG